MKLCVDCRWFRKTSFWEEVKVELFGGPFDFACKWACDHPRNVRHVGNSVDGGWSYQLDPHQSRYWGTGPCGKKGNLWESK